MKNEEKKFLNCKENKFLNKREAKIKTKFIENAL